MSEGQGFEKEGGDRDIGGEHLRNIDLKLG